MEHLDPVKGKYPNLIPHMTAANQIKGRVEKPDFVGIHLSLGLLFPAHGVINHLDGFPVDGSVIDPIDNLLELGVLFVGLHAQMEGLFHVLNEFLGLIA